MGAGLLHVLESSHFHKFLDLIDNAPLVRGIFNPTYLSLLTYTTGSLETTEGTYFCETSGMSTFTIAPSSFVSLRNCVYADERTYGIQQ